MITHYEITANRKNPLIKEQYLSAINFFKTVGRPYGKEVGESWTDYVRRTAKKVTTEKINI